HSLEARLESLVTEKQKKQLELETISSSLPALRTASGQAQTDQQAAEMALNTSRNELQKAERAAQEQSFNQKLIFNNINDINSKINATSEEIKALTLRKSETEAMLVAAKMD